MLQSIVPLLHLSKFDFELTPWRIESCYEPCVRHSNGVLVTPCLELVTFSSQIQDNVFLGSVFALFIESTSFSPKFPISVRYCTRPVVYNLYVQNEIRNLVLGVQKKER